MIIWRVGEYEIKLPVARGDELEDIPLMTLSVSSPSFSFTLLIKLACTGACSTAVTSEHPST